MERHIALIIFVTAFLLFAEIASEDRRKQSISSASEESASLEG
jgi:hypothetical protein